MIARIAFAFSLLLAGAAAAQEYAVWKDPRTGKSYFRCKDSQGREMLTDNVELCKSYPWPPYYERRELEPSVIPPSRREQAKEPPPPAEPTAPPSR